MRVRSDPGVIPSAAGGQAAVSERRNESGVDVPSDESLVEAAQRGEVRALDALLSRHQDRVLRLTRLLGVPPA